MRLTPGRSFLSLSFLAASVLALHASPSDGDQILRQMSAQLASAPSFRLKAVREVDVALLPGFSLPGQVHVSAVVQRPDKLAAHAVSKAGEHQFCFNGHTLTIYESKNHFYSVVPLHTNLDGLVAELDAKYGFMPPLAEFAVSNPYKDFRSEAQSITNLGRVKIGTGFLGLGGTLCDHLLLKGKDADAELWIGVDSHLPRQLVATFHRTGQPKLKIDFLEWNLGARINPEEFVFTPPKGAQKIEMWTTEKMQKATRN